MTNLHSTRARILLVDDEPSSIEALAAALGSGYELLVATSGTRALYLAGRRPLPDLIVLDISMPDLSGYEVLRRLRSDVVTSDIPVIAVSALDSVDAETAGLEVGAADYITKPFRPASVLARVRVQLELQMTKALLREQTVELEREVSRRVDELLVAKEVAIRALARLAEKRDPETGNHLRRTQEYVRVLASNLRTLPRYRHVLSPSVVDLLARSAPLHDIGKVGVPDHILLKPGPLSPEEWEIMKTHTWLGSDAIEQAELDTDEPVEFLDVAKQIARSHHERWDGTGYPDGLAEHDIPLAARLMAVADVFDALTTARVYKDKMAVAEACEIILRGRGAHFDPDVVDAFERCTEEFTVIMHRYADTESELQAKMALLSGNRVF